MILQSETDWQNLKTEIIGSQPKETFIWHNPPVTFPCFIKWKVVNDVYREVYCSCFYAHEARQLCDEVLLRSV